MRRSRLGSLSEGKRSAVAVVNDSPVGCQSRDRGAPQSTGFAVGEDGGSIEVHSPSLFAAQKSSPLKTRGPRAATPPKCCNKQEFKMLNEGVAKGDYYKLFS